MEINRIVLVGNGFDLAHGLHTKYEDFINWYWNQRVSAFWHNGSNVDKDCLCSFHNLSEPWKTFIFYNNSLSSIPGKDIVNAIMHDTKNFEIAPSPLFEQIWNNIENKRWIDIENEYYIFLSSFLTQSKYDNPQKLNNELEFIKSKLAEYLTFIQDSANNDWKLNEDIKRYLFASFNPNDIAVGSKSLWSDFITYRLNCPDEYWKRLLNTNKITESSWSIRDIHEFKDKFQNQIDNIEGIIPMTFLVPDKIMLLNFNYTSIADSYMPKSIRFPVNHIHGELSKPDNMIFGYGDELDNNFKNLQDLNDNEYLRNIKSVRYLESANYRQLLSFIESAPYQVYIMGHSCGNSDRTLLNTLFEHKNCVSIKPFYYRNEQDGSDNYLDIVQNISRSFTDMKLMRDRIVNKTFCVPLPQSSLQDNS